MKPVLSGFANDEVFVRCEMVDLFNNIHNLSF